jgi:GT2 family glycosyltransferase
MVPRLFGMVTTAASADYTPHALTSFFQTAELGENDRLVLIDNDASYRGSVPSGGAVQVLVNDAPKSFAENVNTAIALADQHEADVYFLNNDVIFTPHWLDDLAIAADDALLSPFSNGEMQHSLGDFKCRFMMDYADYAGHETQLLQIVAEHRTRYSGYIEVFSIPFFCVRIPRRIYRTVGNLDTGFGLGGGEDKDYCLRARRAGFSVRYAQAPYILHFMGKSTWRGRETAQETQRRNQFYKDSFERKWGRPLTRLYITEGRDVLKQYGYENSMPATSEQFSEVIEKLFSMRDNPV